MKHGIAKNQKAAASRLGVSPLEIKRALDAGCEAFRTNGSVDCDSVLVWLAANPEKEGEHSEALNLHLERAKDIRATRMLKEQKFQEKGKLLWPIEKIRFAWSRMVSATKGKLYGSETAIVAEVAMRMSLTPEQQAIIKATIAAHQRRAIKEMHGGEWGKPVCPHCRMEILDHD